MSERGRVNRAMQSAENSLKKIQSTRNPHNQQASWEDFLLHWKRSIELLRSFCKNNGKESVREKRYRERLDDPALNYAWEARNAEEHDTLGSAEAEEGSGSLTINAADRTKPLFIRNLTISGGRITNLDMNNGVVSIEEGRLVMKPVLGPGGKRIVDPPAGLTPGDVCIKAMEFARAFYADVF